MMIERGVLIIAKYLMSSCIKERAPLGLSTVISKAWNKARSEYQSGNGDV